MGIHRTVSSRDRHAVGATCMCCACVPRVCAALALAAGRHLLTCSLARAVQVCRANDDGCAHEEVGADVKVLEHKVRDGPRDDDGHAVGKALDDVVSVLDDRGLWLARRPHVVSTTHQHDTPAYALRQRLCASMGQHIRRTGKGQEQEVRS